MLFRSFRDEDHQPTDYLLTALYNLPEAPWGDLRGKPLDSRYLAKLLKEYDVKSKVLRDGDRTVRGYERADLHDVWQRYLPTEPPLSSQGSVTTETSETERGFP